MRQFDSSKSHHLTVFNWIHVQPQTSDLYLYILVILSIPGIPTMKHFLVQASYSWLIHVTYIPSTSSTSYNITMKSHQEHL